MTAEPYEPSPVLTLVVHEELEHMAQLTFLGGMEDVTDSKQQNPSLYHFFYSTNATCF